MNYLKVTENATRGVTVAATLKEWGETSDVVLKYVRTLIKSENMNNFLVT